MPANAFIAVLSSDILLHSQLRSVAEARKAELQAVFAPNQLYSALEHSGSTERIVAVDADATSFDGIEVVQQLKVQFPEMRVFAFCYAVNTELVRRAKNARADGILTREQVSTLLARIMDVVTSNSPA